MQYRAILYACLFLAPVVADVCDICPALRSDSVEIVCKYEGKSVSCDSTVRPGTIATLGCKYGYKIPLGEDQGYREITCLRGGTWDRAPFKCILECGTAVPQNNTAMIVNGSQVEYGTFPWHVGVYLQINSIGNYEQICGGTLIKPDLVVSAAHCFFEEQFGDGNSVNASLLMVAAGKYHRLYNWPEKYAQKSSVEKIHLPDRYFGRARNYELDIALLRLDTPFGMTTLVRTICMDWENLHERDQLQSEVIGKELSVYETVVDFRYPVVGWGIDASGAPSPTLQEINLPFIPYADCIARVPQDFKDIIVADKICAGYLNGSSVCVGDSGGGLCFESAAGRWFLRGIVSIAPFRASSDRPCESNSYTAFTNVGNHLAWIRNIYFSQGESLPSGCVTERVSTCVLPENPKSGSYRIGFCEGECSVEPGRRVHLGTFLVYECDEGYTLEGNKASFCYENGWYRLPTCRKACPALRSKNVDIVCKYRGEIVSCANPMESGTRANMSCRKFYKISGDRSTARNEITCLEEGVWDHPMVQCIPECGIALDRHSPLIINDVAVKHGGFPWHIRMYSRPSQESRGEYTKEQMGSLISPDLVLTSNRSFFGNTYSLPNISELVVTASKYHPSYHVTEFTSQESTVKRVSFLNVNMVLIHLETPFIVTTLVRPVCIDWDNNLGAKHLRKGKILKVPNDIYEDGLFSETKSGETDMVYIPRKECIAAAEERLKYVMHGPHMFCANDSANHLTGEYGAGLYFQSDGLWYLGGILNDFLFNSERGFILSVFTNVGHVRGRIRTAYNASVM